MTKRVTIQLDVPRELRFNGKALMRLEEITGKNIISVMKSFAVDDESGTEEEVNQRRAEKFSFKLVAQIAQAGLIEELPHATTEDIIGLMDEHGKGETPFQRILSFTEKVFGTLAESVGTDEDKAKNVKTGPDKKK